MSVTDTPKTVTVPVIDHDAKALFLRETWADGSDSDGNTIEFTRTIGGGALVLQITRPDGDRLVQSINVQELIRAWADALLNQPASH